MKIRIRNRSLFAAQHFLLPIFYTYTNMRGQQRFSFEKPNLFAGIIGKGRSNDQYSLISNDDSFINFVLYSTLVLDLLFFHNRSKVCFEKAC